MERLNTPEREADFGSLASGLINMVEKDALGIVVAVNRNYGTTEQDQAIEPVFEAPFSDFCAPVMPCMQAIAANESEPKVMPVVLERWREHAGDIVEARI
ncbi:MAG: hypothetical protein VCA12_07650 [Pseudomonadales bacterium]